MLWHTTATDVLSYLVQLSKYLNEPLTHIHLFPLLFYHRLICLTSKCMHTSLPSLHPPPSGAAVKGFAAAVSCYDVKTTTPFPVPVSLVHVPRSPSLDPWPAVPLPAPCHRVHAGVSPFLSCRERERAKQHYRVLGNFPKNIPNSPHHTNTYTNTTAFHTCWYKDTRAQINS